MARLASITGKNQVPARYHPIVDRVIQSRGAVQGPFMMLLHCPPLAEHVMSPGASKKPARPSIKMINNQNK
jgi:hypothetical protein